MVTVVTVVAVVTVVTVVEALVSAVAVVVVVVMVVMIIVVVVVDGAVVMVCHDHHLKPVLFYLVLRIILNSSLYFDN